MSLLQVLKLWTSRVLRMWSRDKYFECGPLNAPSRGTIHISSVLFPDVFIALWMKRHIILAISLGICGTCGKEPACWYRRYETQVQSLGLEDSLKEEMATHSIFLAWKIPMGKAWWATVHRVSKSWTQLSTRDTISDIGYPPSNYHYLFYS